MRPRPASPGPRPSPARSAAPASPRRRRSPTGRTRRARRRAMAISFDLTVAWALLLAFAIYVYVVLDGFDLGIGILYPFFPEKARPRPADELGRAGLGRQRDLAGARRRRPLRRLPARLRDHHAGGLSAGHRHAAGADLPRRRLRVPLAARWRPQPSWLWDWAFIGGSAVAAVAQGIILGALLQGIAVEGRAYGGGWWDWLTPFTLLCGAAVACGYALLGACWLNIKIEGPLHEPDQARSPGASASPPSASSSRSASRRRSSRSPTGSAGSAGRSSSSSRRCRSPSAC